MKSLMIQCVGEKFLIVMQMLLFGNDRNFILLHLVPEPNMYFIAAPSFITNLQITVQIGEMHWQELLP